jgi:uncharacterized protein YbjT (DUF2867 family)
VILATGASGNVGGSALQELLHRGAPVGAMHRSQEEAAKAPPWRRPWCGLCRPGLDRALEGIESVFLVCAPVPRLVELEGLRKALSSMLAAPTRSLPRSM